MMSRLTALVVVCVLVGVAASTRASESLEDHEQRVMEKLGKLLGGARAKKAASHFNIDNSFWDAQYERNQQDKKKQEELIQQKAQEAAIAAAQQQAYLDAVAFQQQAILLQQQAVAAAHRHRRHHRHHHKGSKKHHHRRHHASPATYGSFFQQYYSMQPQAGGYPYPAQMMDSRPHHHHRRHKSRKSRKHASKESVAPPVAEMPRFQQQLPSNDKPVLEYGDPFNTARFTAVDHTASAPLSTSDSSPGSAYGPPQSAPVDEPVSRMASNIQIPASPQQLPSLGSAPIPQPGPQFRGQSLPRFREQVRDLDGRGNPNPTGVPLPFFAPNQAPPPAPNQIPSSSAAVQQVYPFNMQQATSVGVRPALGNQFGLNTAAINFSPLGVHSDINSYPFSSFLELETAVSMPREEIEEREHKIVHPKMYALARDPARFTRVEPLHEEHLEHFPLI